MNRKTKSIIFSVVAIILLAATITSGVIATKSAVAMNEAKAEYVEIAKKQELMTIGKANLDAELESKENDVNSNKDQMYKFFAVTILLFLALIIILLVFYLQFSKNKISKSKKE